jgi:hypothetical protein
MKKLLFALALTCSLLVSCKEETPDYAAGIEGKYKVKTITRNGVVGAVDSDNDYIELTRTTDNTVTYYQHLSTGDTTYLNVVIDSYSNAFHLKYINTLVADDTLTGDESYKNLTIKIKNGTRIVNLTAGR